MTLPAGLKIISLDAQTAQVRMRAPFVNDSIHATEKLAEALRTAQLWRQNTTQGKNDNFNFEKVADILPKDEEYITVNFRALSKTIVEGHWIDWSKDNVLKDSLSKLLGATVYPNHEFSDINNWLGSVSNVEWDETGANSEGIAGINAEYKIDALMNPRIARGLLMKPPAIHSTSMTVLFKFEPSHTDIWNESRWRFVELLGEEIEGEIVRFIVTEILEYWEASLVFQGADRLAKQFDTEDDKEDFETLSAARLSKPTNSNEEKKTMKLTKEQKAELGIEFAGEDVPETEIFKAAQALAAKSKNFEGVDLAQLKKDAAATATLLTDKRTEVTTLARLAELGSEEGELPKVISQQIDNADAATLVELKTYYEKKAADRFPNGRSSATGSKEVETAGGINKTQQQTGKVPVGGLL